MGGSHPGPPVPGPGGGAAGETAGRILSPRDLQPQQPGRVCDVLRRHVTDDIAETEHSKHTYSQLQHFGNLSDITR